MISFVTACTRPDRLLELLPTVEDQRVEREWIVQLDGAAMSDADALRERLAGHTWISVRVNDVPAGSAVSRNAALIAARGETVLCVDDDDLLCRDTVHLLADALQDEPRAFGACGATLAFEDEPAAGRPFKQWPQGGVVAPGVLGAEFERTGRIPLHVGACLWRRDCLVAAGGFAALPRSIDTAPFLACAAVRPVVYVDQPIYLYRMHGDQMSAGSGYRMSRAQVHAFVNERARLVSKLLS